MMYYKAVTFNDHGSATKIIEESSPRKQKSLGRKVANFDGKLWDSVKQQIVEDGNYLKFTQAKDDPAELAAALLATGERLLVEVTACSDTKMMLFTYLSCRLPPLIGSGVLVSVLLRPARTKTCGARTSLERL